MLAIHERLTLCCTGATPLPVSDSVTGELPALLTNENVAVVVPDTCGRKVTVNGIDCPAASVVGREIPLNTNSVLVLVTEESVTEEPLAVSVPLRTALEPSVTLPKLNAVGVNDNCPEVAAVPESPIFSWESDALERIAMVPEAEPSPETISHEIAEGQSNESASSRLAAGHQRKHKGTVSESPD